MADLRMPVADEQHHETVLALDNVPLSLPISRVGSRLLAMVLDYLVLTLLSLAWFIGMALLAGLLDLGVGWFMTLLIVGWFLLQSSYFAVSEVLLRGRTLGKAAIGLRVVRADGGTPATGSLIVRNVVRTVDWIVAMPIMAYDDLARRPGDRLANTLVVHDAKKENEVVLGRLPQGWGAAEVQVAEAFFERLQELDPDRARFLGRRLWRLVERYDPAFLAQVEATGDPVDGLTRAFRVQADRGTAHAT